MNEFIPELGQIVFGNAGSSFEYGMQYHVEMGIHAIGAIVAPLCEGGQDPCANAGAQYENEVFVIRAYCWCDETRPGHEEGCPPNFVCGDFAATWYKHAGRGNSQSRLLTEAEWLAIMRRCLDSLPREDSYRSLLTLNRPQLLDLNARDQRQIDTMTVCRDVGSGDRLLHLPGPNPGTPYTVCGLDAGLMTREERPKEAEMWCPLCLAERPPQQDQP